MGLPVIGLAVKLIGSGIGLASEVIAANKERSETSLANPLPEQSLVSSNDQTLDAPPPYTEHCTEDSSEGAKGGIPKDQAPPADVKQHPTSSEEIHRDNNDNSIGEDEVDWAFDDAANEIEETNNTNLEKKSSTGTQPTIESLAATILAKCPPFNSISRLPHPVIIPQRRPGQKDRGFIRAYAPILAGNGISQEAFLSFLKSLQTASKASTALNVVSISTAIVPFINFAISKAMEVQKRQHANSFMDEMNDKLFKPRGLYALVLTYRPHATAPVFAQSSSNGMYGELELPEAAPLVFPALETTLSESTKDANKFKKSQKILADYYDRRAQAIYSTNNPSSTLDQTPKFASRFSDPRNPVHNGSLTALITGGRFSLSAKVQEKLVEKTDSRNNTSRRRERGPGGLEQDAFQHQGPRDCYQRGRMPRRMQEDILYLMIVNLPSAEELSIEREP